MEREARGIDQALRQSVLYKPHTMRVATVVPLVDALTQRFHDSVEWGAANRPNVLADDFRCEYLAHVRKHAERAAVDGFLTAASLNRLPEHLRDNLVDASRQEWSDTKLHASLVNVVPTEDWSSLVREEGTRRVLGSKKPLPTIERWALPTSARDELMNTLPGGATSAHGPFKLAGQPYLVIKRVRSEDTILYFFTGGGATCGHVAVPRKPE